MNKFVKINYFPRAALDNGIAFYADDGKPLQLILALDVIKAIAPKPNSWRVFDNLSELRHDDGKFKLVELYRITTDIAYGRGINGVGFDSYDITKESYENLLASIDIA
jgi:hypothetical protein